MTIGDTSQPTLWEGAPQTLTSAATGGRMAPRYRVTSSHLFVESGVLTTNSQQLALADVRDVDLRQSMTQKARGIGDVTVHTNTPAGSIVLESIKDPKAVRDIINRAANEARTPRRREV